MTSLRLKSFLIKLSLVRISYIHNGSLRPTAKVEVSLIPFAQLALVKSIELHTFLLSSE